MWSAVVSLYLLIGTVVVFISWKQNQSKYRIPDTLMPLTMILVALFWPMVLSISLVVVLGKKKFVLGTKDDSGAGTDTK